MSLVLCLCALCIAGGEAIDDWYSDVDETYNYIINKQ